MLFLASLDFIFGIIHFLYNNTADAPNAVHLPYAFIDLNLTFAFIAVEKVSVNP